MDFAAMKRRDLQALCKRHGLPAGGTNAALVARLADALPGAADAGDEVAARKGCLKRAAGGGDLGEAKKVSFKLEESRGRRRRSQVAICSPAVVAKTRGRGKAAETLPSEEDGVAADTGAGAPVRRSRRNSVSLTDTEAVTSSLVVVLKARGRGKATETLPAGCGSAEGDGVSSEAGAVAPVRRSRRKSLSLSDAEAVEAEVAVTVDRNRKRKSQEKDEDTTVGTQVGVSRRVTRRSSLSGAALLSPPAVEKKRGRRKAADGKTESDGEEQAAEAQDLAEAELPGPAIVESKRIGRKKENCEPVVQKSAEVEAPVRITRSRLVAATETAPIVVQNKRRKTAQDAQPDVEQPPVLEVPGNGAPVTRALRNRVVQVNNSVVEETLVGKKLENKRQPGRPSTRRNQQLVSPLEEEDQEQVVSPSKCPPLRRSGRNNSEASNADPEPEANKSGSALVEANDLNIVQPITSRNAKVEDAEKKPAAKEPIRRSTRKSVVSAMLQKEDNSLTAEKFPEPEAHARRSKRKSVVSMEYMKGVDEDIQSAIGDDIGKQPAVKEPVRRSNRKSVVSAMLEEGDKDQIAEKQPEADVRRSKRKSVVLDKDIKDVGELIHNTKVEDVAKQPRAKEPVRRSKRKSVVSAMLENETDLTAENNPEAHVRRSTRRSVVPAKDTEVVGEEIRNVKGGDAEKQLVVKLPVRRSYRKSAPPYMLDHESGFVVAEINAEAHFRRSMRKSVLPNMLNNEDQDHSKKASSEDFQCGQSRDEKKQLKVMEPGRLSRRSVAKVVSEKEKKGFPREKKSEIPMRSTRKSAALNTVENWSIDNSEMVENEQSGVGTPNLEANAQLTGHAVAVATSEKDNNAGSNLEKALRPRQVLNSSTSKGRPAKRGRTVPDEVLSTEEAKSDDMVIREATHDGDKVTHEDSKESGSRIQEIRLTTSTNILDAEAPIDDCATINAMPSKQSGAEVALTNLSCCDSITAIVTEPQFSEKRDNQDACTEASEIHRDAVSEKSIQYDDLETCLSKVIEGNPLSRNLHSESTADDSVLPVLNATKGFSSSSTDDSILPVLNATKEFPSDGRRSSFGLEFLFVEECKKSCSRNDKSIAAEVEYGNKSSTCMSPSDMRSNCGVEDEDVQPIRYDADKKRAGDQGVAQEESVAEKSDSEHVAAKSNPKTMLNDEPVRLYMESDCSIAESNMRFNVQQGAVHEGTLEKPSLLSTLPERKHEYASPEEAVLHSVKNKECSPSAEQSPFGLQSLFSQDSIEDSVEHGSLTSATSHVKCTVEKTPVSEPVSHHDTHEELPEVNHGEERVSSSLSGFLVGANRTKEVINSKEVACKDERNTKLFHSEDLNTSCEKSDVNVTADSAYGISGAVLSSSLHAHNDDVCSGTNLAQLESADFLDEMIGSSNIEVMHPNQKDQCNEDMENESDSRACTDDIIEFAIAKCIESRGVLPTVEERSKLIEGQLNSKLEGTQVVESGCNCNKDINYSLDNDSVAGITDKRTSPDPPLPKDSPADHNLQHELLDDTPVEKSIEESAMFGEGVVSNAAGTIGNTSCCLDTPDYGHKGALSEEVAHTMKKYVGSCPSNPRELLMELQSFSKENIEEPDLDTFTFHISGSRGAESTDVEQQVTHLQVTHLGSNLLHVVDESIWCSNSDMLHQGHKDQCNQDNEEKVASGPCTNNINPATIVKYIESEKELLPLEETPDLQDGQLNLMLEGAKTVESGLNSNKGDILDVASACITGKRNPSDHCLPKFSSRDHYIQHELLDDLSMDKSLEGSSIFGDKSDFRMGGSIGNPISGLATPDYKHIGVLFEEVVNTMNDYVGTCPSNPKELLLELQSLNENIKESDTHDNIAFRSAENGGQESTGSPIKNLVDTLVSSEPDTYQGPIQDFSRAEAVSLHDNEEGICQSSGGKHIDEKNSKLLSCDTEVVHQDRVEECCELNEDKVLQKGICEAAPSEGAEDTITLDGEFEEYRFSCDKNTDEIFCIISAKNSMPHLPKDCHLDPCEKQEFLDDLSLPKCPELLGPGTCQTSGQKCTHESSTKQLTCHIGMLNQDHKGFSDNNEEQTTLPTASSMSETVPTEKPERGIYVISSAGTSALPDQQLITKLEDNEFEEHNCSYGKDAFSSSGTESVGNGKASNLPKATQLDPSSEHNSIDGLSAPRSPKESCTVQNDSVSGSVGITQSMRRTAMDEISSKQQSLKGSSTVKGSFFAMSATRPEQGDNLSQSAIALLRNIENTPAIKADHPVKPNPDQSFAKDSLRRALQPLSGRPWDR